MEIDHPDLLETVVVGANFRTSSLSLRDRLIVEDQDVPLFLEKLKSVGFEQAVLLSTCDRVEVQGLSRTPREAVAGIKQLLCDRAGVSFGELDEQAYTYTGIDGVRQMMRVASSLDSLVIGESQVIGQVKASHRLSSQNQMVGKDLENILQVVYAVAKRARTETQIGEFPISIVAASRQLARDVHGNLAGCEILLIGDGDLGELVAGDLASRNDANLTVAHPSERRSGALSRRLECHEVPWNALAAGVVKSDIIVSALGDRDYVLDVDKLSRVIVQRRHKPVFVIDLAHPGDVDPAVHRVDDVFLYALSDLEQAAAQGRRLRETEAEKASRIIEQELSVYAASIQARQASPLINRLREHVADIRQQALVDAKGDAEKATHLMSSRLLHGPTVALRDGAMDGEEDCMIELERALERLFPLNYQTTTNEPDGD